MSIYLHFGWCRGSVSESVSPPLLLFNVCDMNHTWKLKFVTSFLFSGRFVPGKNKLTMCLKNELLRENVIRKPRQQKHAEEWNGCPWTVQNVFFACFLHFKIFWWFWKTRLDCKYYPSQSQTIPSSYRTFKNEWMNRSITIDEQEVSIDYNRILLSTDTKTGL